MVVWRDNNVYRLLIKESLVIRAHEPRLKSNYPFDVSSGLSRRLGKTLGPWPEWMTFLSFLPIDRVEHIARSEELMKKTDDDPNNKRTSVLHSFMSSPSSRTRRLFVTCWWRAALLIEHLSPLRSSSLPTLTCMCFLRALLRVCLRVCVCVCVSSISFSRSPSKCLSVFLSSLSPWM